MRRINLARPLGPLALVALSVALPAALSPSAARSDGIFFDTVDVEVVNVEVVVVDRDGDPVTGLTVADFEIFVDGERVEITNFFAVEDRRSVPTGGDAGPTGDEQEGLGPEGPESELLPIPSTKRLNLVVFVDDFNMRPENRNLIFDDLRGYLREHLDPRDRIMLVNMNDTVEVVQRFTNDVELILRSIDELEKRVGSYVRFEAEHRNLMRRLQNARLASSSAGTEAVESRALFDDAQHTAERLAQDVQTLAEVRHQRTLATLRALESYTDSLAGIEGRKAIAYVSDGLPSRTGDSLAQAWMNKFEQWAFVTNAQGVQDDLSRISRLASSSQHDLSNEIERLAQHASANGVVFYPISNGSRLIGSSISAEHGALGSELGTGVMSADVVALEQQSLESSLLQLAAGTGGIAFTRTANISGLLNRMVGDFESFYSLGYSPTADDYELHRVEVKASRAGLEVRHLGTHRQVDPVEHLVALARSALHYGTEDNRLGVRIEPGPAEPTDKRGRFQVPVMIKIPFQELLLVPQQEMHVARLSLVVVVRDQDDGGISEPQRIDLPIQIPNDQILQALGGAAAYPLQLDMKKGPKRISLGVRDHLARIDSTISFDLEVPGVPGK